MNTDLAEKAARAMLEAARAHRDHQQRHKHIQLIESVQVKSCNTVDELLEELIRIFTP
jgi:predicted metal-dependent hydrolase